VIVVNGECMYRKLTFDSIVPSLRPVPANAAGLELKIELDPEFELRLRDFFNFSFSLSIVLYRFFKV
jgi:hypothetical protein